MTASVAERPTAPRSPATAPGRPERAGLRPARLAVLLVAAVAFLFPFYYMIVGSLQKTPDSTIAGAVPHPSNTTGADYSQIDSAIHLGRSLLNSGIFTIGVLLCTLVFGLMAGYALARLRFAGRSSLLTSLILVQAVPFQLLVLPLYVLIVRDYGLGDNYLGMILPFAINSTAVFVFRQFFVQIPAEMFEQARIDGAGELTVLWRIAIPVARPAILTGVLLTFIGPWNEFLWPFLVTKDQNMEPLAVSLANFTSNLQATLVANPTGGIMAAAVILAIPAVVLFLVFQRHFTSTHIDAGVKG
ncbi:carbohydrate ABC transporter permease [Streptomyces sp. SL13]|uniref:Carbohydrate ABC transporter permease n=1 Tax=Streptantibioticus silvisoli TaxID=2705255 RepID=A0AA90K059_9ACTN|nr:carbohydrate ABC transporter permease [Streptantibioticus silvisoli]MDI5966138.1 carbohydrate ABC transporter permease [Streptantibioticus silvisoli]MDI5972761.1 carbohydrate ABC transporter permease [Streptantibioticus silvisoli]